MKTIKYSVWAIMLLAATLVSCTDKMDWDIDPTLDRCFSATSLSVDPTDTEAEVTFDAGMMKANGAEKFEIQVTTATLEDDEAWDNSDEVLTFETDNSPYTITGLIGDTEYSLRMRALSSQKTASHWVHYASSTKTTFKTKAEQIMNAVANADRGEDFITVSWDASKAVTKLTVSDGTEEEGQEPRTIELDDEAKAAGRQTITGLTPSTNYTITIYYNDTKRGSVTASTAAAMPAGDEKVELDPSITTINNDVIANIVTAAQEKTGKTNVAITIGLQPNQTYTMVSAAEDGTDANVKIPEGASVTFFGLAGDSKPVLNWKKCLDIAGSHAYIRFQNVSMKDTGCQYLINQDKDAAVGELSFTDCTFSGFESSVFRTKGGVVSVDKILVDNCVMTNMSTGGGYPVFYIGSTTTTIGQLELKNSTFDTTSHNFIQLKAAISGGVTISDCTFYNNVSGSKYFMDSNKLNTNLTIIRTVLGMSMDAAARGVRTTGSIIINESMRAKDCVYGSNDIKEFAVGSLTSDEIFTDPANHNFTMKIDDRIGDPRWYKAE